MGSQEGVAKRADAGCAAISTRRFCPTKVKAPANRPTGDKGNDSLEQSSQKLLIGDVIGLFPEAIPQLI